MPARERRSAPEDKTDYGMLLLCLTVGIIGAYTVGAVFVSYLADRSPRLAGLPWMFLLGIPAAAALACAVAYCVLGTLKGQPWMRDHFGWLWWMIIDDEDCGAKVKPPEPDSARGILNHALDKLGERVKDAIMDLGVSDSTGPKPEVPPPLPPLERERFVAILRPRVEELLTCMADEINHAPTGRVLEFSEARVHRLLDQLEHEVLAKGVQMRVDAAYAELPRDRRPFGEWARRYRIMVSAGKQDR